MVSAPAYNSATRKQATPKRNSKSRRKAKAQELITLSARIISWTQYNTDAERPWGFGSFLPQKSDGSGWSHESFKFSGSHYGLKPSSQVQFEGYWEETTQYGRQFIVQKWQEDTSPESGGLAIYLAGKKSLWGLGQAKAHKLVELYGDAEGIETACAESPDMVATAVGIKRDTVDLILKTLRDEKVLLSTRTWLAGFGITLNKIEILIENYGWETRQIIEDNPYTIIRDIKGFGFATVDQIALRIKSDKNDPNRIRHGLAWVLSLETENGGHCYTDESELIRAAKQSLALDCLDFEARIKNALAELVESKSVVLSESSIDGIKRYALPDIHAAEAEIFKTLRDHSHSRVEGTAENESGETDINLDEVKEKFPELNAEQAQAVVSAFTHRVSVITGAAGSGKTYTLKTIADICADRDLSIEFCSPTGKAARRITESTGCKAKTVHRTLEYHPQYGFQCNKHRKLKCDLLVIDESSMLDVELMSDLFDAVDFSSTSVILVGDHNQLPPVGAGYPFRDIIKCRLAPIAELKTVMRQAGSLRENCVAILDGELRPQGKKSTEGEILPWYVFTKQVPMSFGKTDLIDARNAEAWIVELIDKHLHGKFDLLREVQVITPMRTAGRTLGGSNLNLLIQRVVQHRVHGVELPPVNLYGSADGNSNRVTNPKPDSKSANQKSAKPEILLGDKVIQTKNDYDLGSFGGVMNGTIGIVTDVLTDSKDKKTLVVDFEDGQSVKISGKKINSLELAYALTCHKAQGSEFPCVIVACHRTHTHMLNRNWLYTAVTRARKTCVIVGEPTGVRRALDKVDVDKRRTFLSLAGVAAQVAVGEGE